MKWLLLILCLALTACTTKQRVVGVGALGIGVWALSQKNDDKKETKSSVIEVDLSGTMIDLGGAAISPDEVIHVTHWHGVAPVETVRFKGRDGTVQKSEIVEIIDLGNDLVILKISPALDVKNHAIYPVADPMTGKPLTVYRLRRGPFGTVSDGTRDGLSFIRTKGAIETGDSGKIHVQSIAGVPHVVSLTSTESGKGPHVARLLKDYRAETQITSEK